MSIFSNFEQLYAYWLNTCLLNSFTIKFSKKFLNVKTWVKLFVVQFRNNLKNIVMESFQESRSKQQNI